MKKSYESSKRETLSNSTYMANKRTSKSPTAFNAFKVRSSGIRGKKLIEGNKYSGKTPCCLISNYKNRLPKPDEVRSSNHSPSPHSISKGKKSENKKEIVFLPPCQSIGPRPKYKSSDTTLSKVLTKYRNINSEVLEEVLNQDEGIGFLKHSHQSPSPIKSTTLNCFLLSRPNSRRKNQEIIISDNSPCSLKRLGNQTSYAITNKSIGKILRSRAQSTLIMPRNILNENPTHNPPDLSKQVNTTTANMLRIRSISSFNVDRYKSLKKFKFQGLEDEENILIDKENDMEPREKFKIFKLQILKENDRVNNILGDLKRQQSLNETVLKVYTTKLLIDKIKGEKMKLVK